MTKPCAGLGVHLPVMKICPLDSSTQITLIHRLLQNFTIYALSDLTFVIFSGARAYILYILWGALGYKCTLYWYIHYICYLTAWLKGFVTKINNHILINYKFIQNPAKSRNSWINVNYNLCKLALNKCKIQFLFYLQFFSYSKLKILMILHWHLLWMMSEGKIL